MLIGSLQAATKKWVTLNYVTAHHDPPPFKIQFLNLVSINSLMCILIYGELMTENHG